MSYIKYKINAAIFDVDGTLLDTMPIWENAAEIFVKQKGGRAEKGLSKKLYKMSMLEGAEYIKKTSGITLSPREIIDGMAEIVIEFYKKEADFKPGAEQFVKAMQANKIPMIIATANEKATVQAALKRLNIEDCFADIITCSDMCTSKTKPDIFIQASEILKLPPSEIWVFEDSCHALQTAHDAGFMTAAVYDASAHDDIEKIKATADIYMQKFWDFDSFRRAAGKMNSNEQ